MLYDWNLRQFFSQLVPAHELELFLREVVTLDWHGQHDAGRPFAETSAELIADWPRFAAAIAAFGPRFNDTITGLIPGMDAIVHDLNARGVPLYAITNFSQEFWPPFRAREAALFDLFDDILVSGEVRLIKPDPAIYALALERFGLSDGEAIFIDDRDDNVRAAEKAGLTGHHFRDAPTLRAELESLNLL